MTIIDLNNAKNDQQVLDKLISVIANSMIKFNVCELVFPPRPPKITENKTIWEEISKNLFNCYDYNNLQRLYGWWQNKNSTFKKDIIDKINTLRMNNKNNQFANISKNKIRLKDWISHCSMYKINANSRPRLSSKIYNEVFKNILAPRTKCTSIMETSNWFAFDQSNIIFIYTYHIIYGKQRSIPYFYRKPLNIFFSKKNIDLVLYFPKCSWWWLPPLIGHFGQDDL